MAGIPSTLFLNAGSLFCHSQSSSCRALNSCFVEKRALVRCSAKKKIGFMDQILDYIEGTVCTVFVVPKLWIIRKNGKFNHSINIIRTLNFVFFKGGPKLRKWYGAPDLPAKDGSVVEDDDQSGSLWMVVRGCFSLYSFWDLKEFWIVHWKDRGRRSQGRSFGNWRRQWDRPGVCCFWILFFLALKIESTVKGLTIDLKALGQLDIDLV